MTMKTQAYGHRVVLCGSPRAGKKRIIEAIARHLCASSSSVAISMADGPPAHVSWQTNFRDVGMVRFETLHGPGLDYDQAVARLFAYPVSVVIYVLGQAHWDPVFEDSWRTLELSSFAAYSAVSSAQNATWANVPWLLIKHLKFSAVSSDAEWATETVPAELLGSAIFVDVENDSGIVELLSTLDEALRDGQDAWRAR